MLRFALSMTLVLAACASGDTAEQVSAASDSAAAATARRPAAADVGGNHAVHRQRAALGHARGFSPESFVLVHGAPGTGQAPALEAMAEDRLTARYDLLGTGKSDALPYGPHQHPAVDDLVAAPPPEVELARPRAPYGAAIAIELRGSARSGGQRR
jgi:hypothetical protein